MAEATRTESERQVLEGMKRIWVTSEILKNVAADQRLLLDHARDQRVPLGMREVFQRGADRYETDTIPVLVRLFNEMPDVPARARELMFTADEYIARARQDLDDDARRIEMLETASKDPRLKRGGELAVVSRLETALREKGQAENEATQRMLKTANDELVRALVRFTEINARDEMRTMAAIRRDHGIQEPALGMLRGIENGFVLAWIGISRAASVDSRFPKDFQAFMQKSFQEAKQYVWDAGKQSELEKIAIDFGAPTTQQELIDNQRAAVSRLEAQVLDPKTKKETRAELMVWIEGLQNRILDQEIELSAVTSARNVEMGIAEARAQLRKEPWDEAGERETARRMENGSPTG
jgi:hypothetical protein